MQLTAQQLAKCMQCPIDRAVKWVDYINATTDKYQINTPLRQAHFLAQIGHESGRLYYVKELASGEDYDTGKKAIALGNTPEKDGDGQKCKGRGLIEITGLTNYKAVSIALGVDFVKNPELLETPQYASLSSGWFWDSRKLNDFADRDWLIRITFKVNGGQNGIDDRRAILITSKKVLGI